MVQRPSDDPQVELDRLRTENAALRARIDKTEAGKAQRAEVLKTGGKLLLPMFDRQRVVRNGLSLFDVLTNFAHGKEQWPPREQILAEGREFVMSALRFMVRRRMLMIVISLLAFCVPLVQVWLVFQQNAIIENQDKYFNIQVYDIVARSLTGRDTTAKQITAALLAREDFGLVNGIIRSVFESEAGGAFTEEDVTGGRPVFLGETAARGHLVSALVQALERHGRTKSHDDLWEEAAPTIRLVARDAATRLPQLLRLSRKVAFKDPAVGQECFRYLFALSSLLRRGESLSRSAGEEEVYFAAIAPVVERLSLLRLADDGPFSAVLVSSWNELLVDVALEPEFGEAAPALGTRELGPLLNQGLERLVAGTKPHAARLSEPGLRELLGVKK